MFSSMQLGNRNNYTRLNKKIYYNHLIGNNFQTESSNAIKKRNEGNTNFNLNDNIQYLSISSKRENNDYSSLNKSRNQLDMKNNIKFDNILNKKRHIKSYESDNSGNNKDAIERIKLAKLGKLIKHLNEENNIINTIKEQFLNWTNKSEIEVNPTLKNDIKENIHNLMNYKINTFEKENRNDSEKIENITNDKINEFRYKLISFCLKNIKTSKI